jgi:predicted CXXCH cytochrome family protein
MNRNKFQISSRTYFGIKAQGSAFRILTLTLTLTFLFIFVWSGIANAQGNLKAAVPDLCYKCHVKLKESLSRPHVHFPFKEGKCISCHNAHTSDIKVLIREDINTLCLSCHDGIDKALKKEYVHYAIKKGKCTDCHYPHSGENAHLLVKPQKDICWTCHESLKEQLKKSVVHSPFKEGACASCHNPHASSFEDQILDDPKTLCKNCHAPKCKVGDVSITFATEKKDCRDCHGGHASDSRGILGPYGHSFFIKENCNQCHNPFAPDTKITVKIEGRDLCLSCHKKDQIKLKENDVHGSDAQGGCAMCHSYHASKRKNLTVKEEGLCIKCHEKTERSTTLMEKALRKIRCVPVKDRKCFECHIPPHSTNPLYFKVDSIQTCSRCHVEQHKVAHPMGKDALDPRNGQPITCITCHSMHSSKAEFMLYYDSKRQLCIQCHKK